MEIVKEIKQMKQIYDYQEYKNRVFEILREEYGEDVVREVKVTKNNNTKLEGIGLHAGTNVASPIIYLDNKKGQYTECDIRSIVKVAEKHLKEIKRFTDKAVEDSRNWRKMKTRIFPKVIHYAKNKDMLMHTPHVRFLDLAVVFFYQTNEMFPELGEGTITVHDGMKQVWDVTEEQLLKYSMRNLRQLKCTCKYLEEVLEGYGVPVGENVKIPLYILTVYNGIYGAAAMLNRTFMEEACEKMGCQKLWIIPSSCHEVLLVPYDFDVVARDLQRMCVEVNGTLDQEDVLSDSIYLYDNETKQIDFADVRGSR